MERRKLMEITEALCSSEVAALCFLCHDVLNRKHLEGVSDAKVLFSRLEEKDLLKNTKFIAQLLHTIRRIDLVRLLETNRQGVEETDAKPMLSNYRVMLYTIYDETTKDKLEDMKFLLSDKIGRRQTDDCNTVLDVFVELEKVGLLSQSNLHELHSILEVVDLQLASTVQQYMTRTLPQPARRPPPRPIMDLRHVNNSHHLSTSETPPTLEGGQFSLDARTNTPPTSLSDQIEYYPLNHIPCGLCVIINNEEFLGTQLKKRSGTREDEEALESLFSRFGFSVIVHSNLTAEEIREKLRIIASRNFSEEDALVVCVLSHGEHGCVYGTDEEKVSLRELTQPFTSGFAPTLAGKPKLFFIQACQGGGYQTGTLPSPPKPREGEYRRSHLEADAGPIHAETVPSDADFLLGMATVPECKSFRNKHTGSIYIQELCRQLRRSAESSREEDILSILTRVNREVSKGEYLNYKQMPEPKYTLTKTLILKFVDEDQVQRP
ncbi:caspase-8 isoform X2 [Phyllopteryx taeniolatus]|uniref:caspase-8 isoform X2 n=1 Tax=Phyllopteryx taeniolatus TaxID=161469 RepID=UPI002AD25D67|nr:caspase-8 isoform X2 [Phyllopteryx taeniolatus]